MSLNMKISSHISMKDVQELSQIPKELNERLINLTQRYIDGR